MDKQNKLLPVRHASAAHAELFLKRAMPTILITIALFLVSALVILIPIKFVLVAIFVGLICFGLKCLVIVKYHDMRAFSDMLVITLISMSASILIIYPNGASHLSKLAWAFQYISILLFSMSVLSLFFARKLLPAPEANIEKM